MKESSDLLKIHKELMNTFNKATKSAIDSIKKELGETDSKVFDEMFEAKMKGDEKTFNQLKDKLSNG